MALSIIEAVILEAGELEEGVDQVLHGQIKEGEAKIDDSIEHLCALSLFYGNNHEEGDRLAHMSSDYISGKKTALADLAHEAEEIKAHPEMVVNPSKVDGGNYNVEKLMKHSRML